MFEIVSSKLENVKVLSLTRFKDQRGFFQEIYHHKKYAKNELNLEFVQDNYSYSQKNVIRGLHFQTENPQGKLVTVLQGRILDVFVDIRPKSASFGKWDSIELDQDIPSQVYVPPGFAHGFIVLSESALVMYKCTDFYDPRSEHTLIWNDPEIAINWGNLAPIISQKDAAGLSLKQIMDRNILGDL